MQLRIVVRTVSGLRTAVSVDAEDTVDKFQATLEQIHGTPVHLQVLLLTKSSDGQMVPGRRLHEYNLKQDDEVLLIRNLPQRPKCKPPFFGTCSAGRKSQGSRKSQHCRRSICSRKSDPEKLHKIRANGKVRPWCSAQPVLPLPPRPTCPPPVVAINDIHQASNADACTASSSVVAAVSSKEMAGGENCDPNKGTFGGSVDARDAKLSLHVGDFVVQQEEHSSSGNFVKTDDPGMPLTPSLQVKPPRKEDALHSGLPSGSGTVAPGPPPPSKEALPGLHMQPRNAGSSGGQRPTGVANLQQEGMTRKVASVSAPSNSALPVGHGSLSWSPPASASAGTTLNRGDASPQTSARVVGFQNIGHTLSAGSSPASRDRALAASTICQTVPGTRIRRSDLQLVGRLGVGAFGVVTLEADRRSGRTFALKAVSKGYLAQLRMEYSVLNEKRILKMVDSPFIVRLIATYNGREHVYFLLEAALGGELFTTYERLRLYGSERHARFYVGCVTEALAHLHERHVIYRDLKPENLLLDSRGYCKLTDMGLAKVTHGQTYTLVGTPDYMAPEVILCTGHSKAVDWWMLGVLLFELLAGRAPFEADTTQQVYELVKRGIEVVRFPHECRRHAVELVRALCNHNPDARLRTPTLRDHLFFRGFDWSALRGQRLTPPHLPHVRGPRDLANFRACDGEDPPVTPYQDTGSGWDAGFEDDTLGASSAKAAPTSSTCPTRTEAMQQTPDDRGGVVIYPAAGSRNPWQPVSAH